MKRIYLGLVLMLGLAGCQTMYVPNAREVKKRPQSGGTIAMPTTYRTEDRDKAESLMKRNCEPMKVKIADEGEVVVGQSTQTNSNSTNRDDTRRDAGSLFGIPMTTGNASGVETQNNAVTKQLTEWQITYACEAEKTASKKH